MIDRYERWILRRGRDAGYGGTFLPFSGDEDAVYLAKERASRLCRGRSDCLGQIHDRMIDALFKWREPEIGWSLIALQLQGNAPHIRAAPGAGGELTYLSPALKIRRGLRLERI